MSSSDRAMLNAFKEISTMADRINLPRNIIVRLAVRLGNRSAKLQDFTGWLVSLVHHTNFWFFCFPLQDRTNNLFKQVYEQKSLKGRANDAIASACLYIACRQEGVPRTFKGQTRLLFKFLTRILHLCCK